MSTESRLRKLFNFEDWESNDSYIVMWDVVLLEDIEHLKSGQKVDTVLICRDIVELYLVRHSDDDAKVPQTDPDVVTRLSILMQ